MHCVSVLLSTSPISTTLSRLQNAQKARADSALFDWAMKQSRSRCQWNLSIKYFQTFAISGRYQPTLLILWEYFWFSKCSAECCTFQTNMLGLAPRMLLKIQQLKPERRAPFVLKMRKSIYMFQFKSTASTKGLKYDTCMYENWVFYFFSIIQLQ